MPTCRGTTWYCDRCNQFGFRNYDEAKAHEMSCDPNVRKRPRPASPSTNNPYGAADKVHAYNMAGQARSDINPSPFPQASFTPFILIPEASQAPETLSQLDVFTCNNVEMFEASSSDVADHDANFSGGMNVNAGQIGLRCIHCAKSPFAKAEYSAVFPAAVAKVAASLRMMIEAHFEKCSSIPRRIKSQLEQAKSVARSRAGEGDEWNQITYNEFCQDLCKRMNIVNRAPAQTGIISGSGESVDNYSTSLMQPTPVIKSRRQDRLDSIHHSQLPSDNLTQYPTPSIPPGSHKQMQQPAIGYTGRSATSGSSPPSLHDSPGSINYPFRQDPSSGYWECKYCCQIPLHLRSHNSIWNYNMDPPKREFIDSHLSQCHPYIHSRLNAHQQSSNQLPSPSNHYFHQQGGVYGQNAGIWGSPQRYQRMPAMPSPQRPPRPHMPVAYNSSIPPWSYMHPDVSQEANPHGIMYPGNPVMDVPLHDNYGNDNDRESAVGVNEAIEYLKKEAAERANSASDQIELVLAEDKYLLTEYFFHIMKQLRLCRFSESDRKTRGGKRENIKIGYGGLQCVHCAESPNPRKFFWSGVDRLANSFAEIPGHVLRCRKCPEQTKAALRTLKLVHADQMAQVERGSQKIFFRRMWRRIHENDDTEVVVTEAIEEAVETGASEQQNSATDEIDILSKTDVPPQKKSIKIDDPDSTTRDFEIGTTTENSAKALAQYAKDPMAKQPSRILLGIDEDREWISDMDCFVRENLEVFCASIDDVNKAQSDRKFPITIGQVGMRCLHCAISSTSDDVARGTAVSFPPSINGIYESVREFQRLHLESCPNLPDDVSSKLRDLKGSSSLSSVLRRHYVSAAKALGMYDCTGGNGIKVGNDSDPTKLDSTEGLALDTPGTPLDNSIRRHETANREYLQSFTQKRDNRKRKFSDATPL